MQLITLECFSIWIQTSAQSLHSTTCDEFMISGRWVNCVKNLVKILCIQPEAILNTQNARIVTNRTLSLMCECTGILYLFLYTTTGGSLSITYKCSWSNLLSFLFYRCWEGEMECCWAPVGMNYLYLQLPWCYGLFYSHNTTLRNWIESFYSLNPYYTVATQANILYLSDNFCVWIYILKVLWRFRWRKELP